jgi:hypothetical protein
MMDFTTSPSTTNEIVGPSVSGVDSDAVLLLMGVEVATLSEAVSVPVPFINDEISQAEITLNEVVNAKHVNNALSFLFIFFLPN